SSAMSWIIAIFGWRPNRPIACASRRRRATPVSSRPSVLRTAMATSRSRRLSLARYTRLRAPSPSSCFNSYLPARTPGNCDVVPEIDNPFVSPAATPPCMQAPYTGGESPDKQRSEVESPEAGGSPAARSHWNVIAMVLVGLRPSGCSRDERNPAPADGLHIARVGGVFGEKVLLHERLHDEERCGNGDEQQIAG